MNKKFIFFDIDGTLKEPSGQISQTVVNAIQKLKQNGHKVAIATGRAPFMFKDVLEQLDIDTFVSYNGQYVVYEGKVIYEGCIEKETLDKIIAYGNEHGDDFVFQDEHGMVATVGDDSFIKESLATMNFGYPPIEPFFYQTNKILQTLIFIDEERQKHYESLFPEVNFVCWYKNACDILPKNNSKINGIHQIIELAGFDIKDVIAFGDGLNDMEMIQGVGYGVAMGNAKEELKQVAKEVTKSIHEDGVVYSLKKLKLI